MVQKIVQSNAPDSTHHLNPSDATMVHSKRKRKAAGLDDIGSESSKRQKSAAQNGNHAAKLSKPIRLDDLNWKSVQIPETLDDYEGFFGLEEVDDVEIVRDTDSGRVSYWAKEDIASDVLAQPSDGNDVGLEYEKGRVVTPYEENSNDEESWEGFSDTLPTTNGSSNVESHNVRNRNKRGEQVKPPKSRENDIQGDEADELEDIPFSELADLDEDDNSTDVSSWKALNLSSETLQSLAKLKFSNPTPIQAKAIPPILSGLDVIGKAATGSGKTLAYGIPMIEAYIQSSVQTKPRKQSRSQDYSVMSLILSPTRELAHQLAAHLTELGKGAFEDSPRISVITGGLSIQKQQRQLQTADIVVATPGRLWEVISTGDRALLSKLQKIRFLVVDEADRLLSEGHFKEVEEILNTLERVDVDDEAAVAEAKRLKSQRQVLVFSATFDRSLRRKLASAKKSPQSQRDDPMTGLESIHYLLEKLPFRSQKPTFIDVDPTSHLASTIRPSLIEVPTPMERDLYLYTILVLTRRRPSTPPPRTLIFTNSIASVRHLTALLSQLGLPARALHSTMPQKARLRALEAFATQASALLVATDVAARGLDVPAVDLVLHYHVARTADAYVHRSGRTARAGAAGASVVLCAGAEAAAVAKLVARVHGAGAAALRTVALDGRAVAGLRRRVEVAARIARVLEAKSKAATKTEGLFEQAARDLGVEEEDWDAEELGRAGRGSARRKREKEDKDVTKAQVAAWKAELKALLNQRVNVGVSERYLTSGTVDIDALLRGENGEFLGTVEDLPIAGD